MENLFARIRRMGFVVVIGVCLIIYAGLGFVYLQQGAKQADLEEQIDKTMLIVSKPLPSIEELQNMMTPTWLWRRWRYQTPSR